MEGEVTNAVLAERLDNFKEEMKKELSALTTQVLKTNGSVTKLKEWRSYMLGGMAVLTLLVVPLLFMVLGIYLKQ